MSHPPVWLLQETLFHSLCPTTSVSFCAFLHFLFLVFLCLYMYSYLHVCSAFKGKHEKLLQDFLLDILRALSSPNTELRRKIIQLTLDLLSSFSSSAASAQAATSQVENVVGVFRRELLHSENMNENSDDADLRIYRKLLVDALYEWWVKLLYFWTIFSHIAHTLSLHETSHLHALLHRHLFFCWLLFYLLFCSALRFLHLLSCLPSLAHPSLSLCFVCLLFPSALRFPAVASSVVSVLLSYVGNLPEVPVTRRQWMQRLLRLEGGGGVTASSKAQAYALIILLVCLLVWFLDSLMSGWMDGWMEWSLGGMDEWMNWCRKFPSARQQLMERQWLLEQVGPQRHLPKLKRMLCFRSFVWLFNGWK